VSSNTGDTLRVSETLLAVLEALSLVLLLGLGRSLGVLEERVLPDLGVGGLVDLLERVGLNAVLGVLGELVTETLLIIVHQSLHVLGDVATEDVLAESLGIELLGLHVVTGESAFGMRDVETTIGSTFHGTEDTGTGRSPDKTDIEESLEGAAFAIIALGSLGEGELTIGLLDTREGLVEVELLEGAAGKEKTGGVGGSPVGKTVGDAVPLKLVGVSGHQDLVTTKLSGHDLADDVAVGEPNDKTVLGGTILVLGLGDKTTTGLVVGLTVAAALVLHLETAEVGVALDDRFL